MKNTIQNQRELKSAFLAGSLAGWQEVLDSTQAPTRLLLFQEALLIFLEIEPEGLKDGSKMICAKKYGDLLNKLKVPTEINTRVLVEWHKEVFEHEDGFRFKPGEFKSKEAEIETEELLKKLNEDFVDPFTNIHLIYTTFVKLAPFCEGNTVMANLLLHSMLIQNKITKSPCLLLSRYVPESGETVYDDFLGGLLSAQEHLQSVYQSVRILQARYEDRIKGLETRPKKLAKELLPFFLERISFTVRDIESAYGKKYKITYHTLNKLMTRLAEDLHLLEIISGGERNRVFSLEGYQKLFSQK